MFLSDDFSLIYLVIYKPAGYPVFCAFDLFVKYGNLQNAMCSLFVVSQCVLDENFLQKFGKLICH